LEITSFYIHNITKIAQTQYFFQFRKKFFQNLLTFQKIGRKIKSRVAKTKVICKTATTSKGGHKMGYKRTYGKLRELIKQRFGTMQNFADAMGKSVSTLSKKLNGIVDWTSSEIEKAAELLGAEDRIQEYFFYL
jgi:hypothetical protein